MRRALAALGYQETINFSFVEERWEHELAGNPNPIKLLNPIASQMSVMRSSLLGSLLQVLKFNLDRKARARSRVRAGPRVPARCVGARTPTPRVAASTSRCAWPAWPTARWTPAMGLRKERGVDFFDVKGDVEALLAPLQAEFRAGDASGHAPGPLRQRVLLGGQAIGFVGELHPRWRQGYELAQAPVLFELELDAVLQRDVPAFQPVAKHQPVERDIAVIVAEAVTHAALMAAIWAAPTRRPAARCDAVRRLPAQARRSVGRIGRGRKEPGGAPDAQQRRRYTDRRTDRGGRAGRAGPI